jgi:hypothetical protein
MFKKIINTAVFSLFAVLFAAAVQAGETQASAGDVLATTVEGTVLVFSNGKQPPLLLKKGSRIKQNQEVRVAEKSRVELLFPDGTVMRLAEKSRLNLGKIAFDKKTEGKNVNVNLGSGKLWAKVKKLVTPDSSVEVRTTNAVAGVRGTVYRVNVNEDLSAIVKVYDGSVYVANPPSDRLSTAGKITAPVPVAGPHEIAPPVHEVSMEEWHVIVKSFQQVSISPQGVASQPQDFDPKADADDWVRWNQERDKDVVF